MTNDLGGLHENQQVLCQLHTLIAEKWEFQTIPENLSTLDNLLKILKISDDSQPCTNCGNILFCQTSQFAHKCLLILQNTAKLYNDTQIATQQSFDLLVSVQDKKQLDYLLFFIVKIGISRHLYFQVTTLSLNFDEPPGPSTCGCKALYQISRDLLLFCDHEYFQSKLSNKYLLDILAGIIQLCYSSHCRKTLSAPERRSCLSLLTHIFTKWAQLDEAVKSLLTLQGSRSSQSPVWLQQTCGMLLSKCLLLPGGVVATINGVLASLETEMSDSKKSEIISKILSTPPKVGISIDEYCSKICNQLLLYLQSGEVSKRPAEKQIFHHVMLDSTVALYEKFPSLVVKIYFRKLFSPLHLLTTENVDNCEVDTDIELLYEKETLSNFYGSPSFLKGITFVMNCLMDLDETFTAESMLEITKSIEYLHFIFTYLRIEKRGNAIRKELVPYIEVFFSIFMWSRNTVCHLQSVLKEVIVATLNACTVDSAVSIIFALCNISTPANQQITILEMRDDISFSLSSDGELEVSIQGSEQTLESIVMEQDRIVQSVIDIVQSIPNKEITSSFFISMLKLLRNLQVENIHDSSNTLMTQEDRAVQHLIAGESQLILFALITSVLESCDPATLLSDIVQISNFVEVMLVRVSESEEENIAVENLKLSFAILGLCLINQGNSTQSETLAHIAPLLQKVSKIPWLAQEEKNTATDLAIAIATHGKGGELDMKMFSSSLQAGVANLENLLDKNGDLTSMGIDDNDFQGVDRSKSSKSHKYGQAMNNLSEMMESVSVKQSTNQTSKNKFDDFKSKEKLSVTEAIDSIFDKSPPIRAAAARHLSNLVTKNDASVTEHQLKLYQLFVERLKSEEDSFVYLTLLQGIFMIINKENFNHEDTDSLILLLFDDYAKCLASKNEFDEVSIVKIGEILVRFIHQLGDLAPHYSNRLVPLLFAGARHSSAQVRASSLSNLAELCPLLRHVLSNFEQELTLCLTAIAKSDEAEPRRAAVFVIRRLIDVLGSDILQVLPNSVKRLYGVLKHVYGVDDDGAATLHAQLALEQLDVVLKETIFLSPKDASKTPTKKIVVLPP